MKNALCVLFLLMISYMGANSVEIPTKHFRIDSEKKLILTNFNVDSFNGEGSVIKELVLDKKYIFQSAQAQIQVGVAYRVSDEEFGEQYTLYFTELPIISINTDFTIVDTPKVLAQFTLIETGKEEIATNIGIEYRGASSQRYPKKSLEIEFWADSTGSSTVDIPILGMMNHDSFNLQAMYNEDSRIRSKTANELWLQMSSLSYQDKEPEAKNGIFTHYVEVFMNNEYYGVYALSEKVNRKNLKLKKYKNGIVGELYKGDDWGFGTLMSGYEAYDNNSGVWGGFEYKHPKEEINWKNLYEFVKFVVDSDTDTFRNEIETKFELNSAIDYFILMNIIRAIDNRGKNLYIARYDQNSKYFYVPWDLDATFGYSWDSTVLNEYTGLLSNGLYDKLLSDKNVNGFSSKLAKRWFELRKNTLSIENIYSLLDANSDELETNNVYARESLAWDYTYNHSAVPYMKEWMQNRIDYLDSQFSPFLSASNPTKPEISMQYFPTQVKDMLNINLPQKENMKVHIYSASGEMMHNETTNSAQNVINLSKLAKGVYFVHCQTEQATKTFKILVTH